MWLGFALMLALAACTDPRKLVLAIDTNAGIPCDVDRIRIRASAADSATLERSLEHVRLPIDVTLLDDTASGSFHLEITGLRGDTEVMRVEGPLQFSSREVTQPVMLDAKCTVDAGCSLAGAMAAGDAPATGGARFQCGPEVTRYAAAATQETFVNACQVPGAISGSVLVDGAPGPVALDKLEAALPGFAFQFFGHPIHRIWVSRDGYLSIESDSPDPDHLLVPGPFDRGIRKVGAAPPPRSVMAFWDTLSLGASGICYELEGAPGAQLIRITWSGACLTTPCTSGSLNFTITLDESTQRIVLGYDIRSSGDRERGATATVGLVDDATGCAADQCALDTGLCSDGVTPCGYSQVFSETVQATGIRNLQFTPVAEP